MFLFLLIAMVVVVGAVTLAVLGGGDSAALPEAAPERLIDPLPMTRPVGRADVEALRLPVAPRGYRMADVDDALARLGAELAERDSRIAGLESALAEARATGATTATDATRAADGPAVGTARVNGTPLDTPAPAADPAADAADDGLRDTAPAPDRTGAPVEPAAPATGRDPADGVRTDDPDPGRDSGRDRVRDSVGDPVGGPGEERGR